MKKILCLGLCLLSLLALFSGCKKAPAPKQTDAETAAVPTLSEPDVTDTASVSEETEAQADGNVNFLGLDAAGVTAEQLATVLGVAPEEVIATTLGTGEELLIVNNVLYNSILYTQLQCINYADKSSVTLTYKPDAEELEGAVEDVLNGIAASLEDEFGAPNISESNSGSMNYTWHSADGSENYILLYPLNDEEVKLSFYLY